MISAGERPLDPFQPNGGSVLLTFFQNRQNRSIILDLEQGHETNYSSFKELL